MEISVKVDLSRHERPVAAVRDVIRTLRPELAKRADVEEVFPGQRTGNRAGMVVVRLGRAWSETDARVVLDALRDLEGVIYAEPARPRA